MRIYEIANLDQAFAMELIHKYFFAAEIGIGWLRFRTVFWLI